MFLRIGTVTPQVIAPHLRRNSTQSVAPKIMPSLVGIRPRLAPVTFCLYRSNRVENLAAALSRVVRTPLLDPFAKECVVVQGPGMERFLSAHLSSELGVWANPWFPFPRAIIELALDAVLGELPESTRVFRPETLTFLIARALDAELLSDQAFGDVSRYVSRDTTQVGRLGLASELARTFDQYLVYRPDVIRSWENGADQHFQAKLWRKLLASAEPTHIAARMEAFQAHLHKHGLSDQALSLLPERISLFGVSTLPPAFLHLLSQLAQHIDVHLFLLTPSPEYWGDFDRKLARGNSVRAMLSTLGRVSREFVDLLLESVPFEEPLGELFELKASSSMLALLQRDISELIERDPTRTDALRPLPIRSDDGSLSVHVCHSATRELEVLRDVLREKLENDRSLEPHDIVVFAPDIERYAPAIEAVFSQSDGENERGGHIPYRIADRRAARSSSLLEAFSALLELVESRLALSDVLDFLHRAPVRERFGLDEGELSELQDCLVEAGARWGMDGAHRTRFGQPAYEQNSLRFALDRLFVGFASAPSEQQSVLETLPYTDVEGERALLIGRFARFSETLFELTQACATPKSPEAWCKLWLETMPRMFAETRELSAEHHSLRAAISSLAQDAELTQYNAEVMLSALRPLLESRFDRGRANLGFLASGITFCEHVPMRAIPFRVVCMVGMDDEAFPRRSRRPSFDLTTETRRAGDRDVREDDRQLFLEALLSARDALVITYVGRSAKDDSERPASVLVDQLLRVLDRHFVLGDASQALLSFERKSASEHVTQVHALHRFDARYFVPHAALGSYDTTAALAARALRAPRKVPQRFISGPIPASPNTAVELEKLVSFFRAPQRAFVRERLRVRLPQESEQTPDREPTALDALERFQLHDRLLTGLRGEARAEQLRVLVQEGKLPPGTTGQVLFEDLEKTIDAMLAELDVGDQTADVRLRIDGPHGQLHGTLRGLHEHARVELSAAAASDKHKLSAWIRHLALCASDSPVKETLLISRTAAGKRGVATLRYPPVERAQEHLDNLLSLYWLGLRMPLPFLPVQSSTYATAWIKERDVALSLERAKRAPPPQFVDSAERYKRQVWSEDELAALEHLAARDENTQLDFAAVAEAVLVPMLTHIKELGT